MATQNLIQLLASGLRDLDGGVLAGGKVWHYEAGTTTDKAIYEDDAAAAESAQPIVLDSRGCAKVYGTGLYDLVVTDAAGVTIESFNGLNAGDAPGSLTAAGLLALLKTVDGATSGLDADQLDGNHASAFLTSASYSAADVLAKLLTVDGTGSGLDADLLDGSHASAFATAAQGAKADTALQASGFTAAAILALLLTVDGAGSGLDADKLDGNEATAFAAASHALSTHSDITFSSPVSGDIMAFNGSAWVNSNPAFLGTCISALYVNGAPVFGTPTYPCFSLKLRVPDWANAYWEVIEYDSEGAVSAIHISLRNFFTQDHAGWASTGTVELFLKTT
jgi:hypothetical protein